MNSSAKRGLAALALAAVVFFALGGVVGFVVRGFVTAPGPQNEKGGAIKPNGGIAQQPIAITSDKVLTSYVTNIAGGEIEFSGKRLLLTGLAGNPVKSANGEYSMILMPGGTENTTGPYYYSAFVIEGKDTGFVMKCVFSNSLLQEVAKIRSGDLVSMIGSVTSSNFTRGDLGLNYQGVGAERVFIVSFQVESIESIEPFEKWRARLRAKKN